MLNVDEQQDKENIQKKKKLCVSHVLKHLQQKGFEKTYPGGALGALMKILWQNVQKKETK